MNSPKTSISIHQTRSHKGISQVRGLQLWKGQGICLFFVCIFSSLSVSCDVKTGPQRPLHHGRHLNTFPLLAFYNTFTAAHVFSTDQSLLLSRSFITTSFLLFFFFLFILSSFTWTDACPHSALLSCTSSCNASSSPRQQIALSLPQFFLTPLFPLFPPLCFHPHTFVFIIC